MAELAAPYFSGSDLTAQRGDAALSGVEANFDPENKNPLHGIEEAQARTQSQIFQRQQQERQQQHDLLSQKIQMEQQLKLLQAKQGLEDRNEFYKMMHETQVRGGNLKDANGNPMPINPLEEDAPELDKQARELNKMGLAKPGAYKFDTDFQNKFQNYQSQTANATAKSKYYKEAQIAMSQTADPEERQNLSRYMENIKKTPLSEVPNPYVSPQMTFQPIVDPSKFKDKDMQQFTNGKGVPQAQFDPILYTNDKRLLEQGFKSYNAFRAMPQSQDAKSYQEYQQAVNEMQAERGQKPLDLGGVITQDGKVAFDDSTRAQQLEHARKFLYADQIMHSGHITPYSEDEIQESQKAKASTRKEVAEAGIKEKELVDGKTLSAAQKVDKDAAEQTINRITPYFEAKNYGEKPIDAAAHSSIDGVDVRSAIKSKGYDPADWVVYKGREGAHDLSGVERVLPKEKGGEERTGQTEAADRVFTLKNKKTGDFRLAFFQEERNTKGAPTGKHKILSIVDEREAITNAVRNKHQFKESKEVSDEINRHLSFRDQNKAKSSSAETDNDEAAIRARLVPISIRKSDGTIINALKDPKTGKRYAA